MGMSWGGTANGWIAKQAFRDWVERTFIPAGHDKRGSSPGRALLILDGHSSRRTPEAIQLLEMARVDTVVLPAHASHVLQPLDDWVFLSFNDALRRSARITRRSDWILRIQDAWRASTSVLKVTGSLERTGIWPFAPDRVLNHPLLVTASDADHEQPQEDPAKGRRIGISNRVLIPSEMRSTIEGRASQLALRDSAQVRKRRPSRCSVCGQMGHNKQTSSRRSK